MPSKLPFTSVVSYHTDPYSCGVARFSMQLAERLGVPFADFNSPDSFGVFPLFSLKLSEMGFLWRSRFDREYGVFWHDSGDDRVTQQAKIVYYADPSLGPNGLWCPSLLDPPAPRPVKLFSFGMAGRLQPACYREVKYLLDEAGINYHLRVSSGIHEGTSLSDAMKGFEVLKEIMGPENVTILGILSDEAVALELRDCDYVLAFFEKGLRANNTTVHAALSLNKTVVTNHDHQTPGFLKASTRDIVTREAWEPRIPYYYSWERLLEQMEKQYAAVTDRKSQSLGR